MLLPWLHIATFAPMFDSSFISVTECVSYCFRLLNWLLQGGWRVFGPPSGSVELARLRKRAVDVCVKVFVWLILWMWSEAKWLVCLVSWLALVVNGKPPVTCCLVNFAFTGLLWSEQSYTSRWRTRCKSNVFTRVNIYFRPVGGALCAFRMRSKHKVNFNTSNFSQKQYFVFKTQICMLV